MPATPPKAKSISDRRSCLPMAPALPTGRAAIPVRRHFFLKLGRVVDSSAFLKVGSQTESTMGTKEIGVQCIALSSVVPTVCCQSRLSVLAMTAPRDGNEWSILYRIVLGGPLGQTSCASKLTYPRMANGHAVDGRPLPSVSFGRHTSRRRPPRRTSFAPRHPG